MNVKFATRHINTAYNFLLYLNRYYTTEMRLICELSHF